MTVFLPPADWRTTPKPVDPVPPRETLNGSATSAAETQLSVAAENAPLRIIYGQARLGPQIAYVLSYQGDLVILAVWGHGEVDSIVSYQIDDADPAGGVSATHYTGTVGQGVDPLLVLAFAAQAPAVTYTDALAGICYSVVRVPGGSSSGFPRLNAVIKGLKVWTGAIPEWSDNPAYCVADFITNDVYGMGRSVDWDSVASVAADNDVLVGIVPNQEKLRTVNLVLETVQTCEQWLDTLRAYAGCWIVPSGPDLKLISDKAAASVASFDHGGGNIAAISPIKKRGVQSTPTVMTVTYTDTTVMPYRDGTAVVYAPGVLEGTTPRRESQVSLPGINRYSQAYREATERLNKLLLNDLSMTLNVFDEGLALEIGDVVEVTHPIGFEAKQLRCMGITGDYGRYSLALVEYDPAVYSAAVVSSPTWVDTTLPNPTTPPALTDLALVEEVFQQQDGTWASRIKATWTAATYAFLKHYRVEFYKTSGMVLVDSQSLDQQASPTYKSPAVADINSGALVNYTVRVQAVSSIGAGGAWATATITPVGKTLLPSNVPGVTGFEVGGEVRLTIQAATDLDMVGYEIRYGTVGVAWGAAKFVDFVNAASGVGGYCVYKDAPAGTWDFLVCARDSIGQYSVTPARIPIVVTLDVNSFLVNNHSYSSPTLTYATKFNLGRVDGIDRYVSDDGVAFGTKFPSALGTYSSLLQTAQASTWLSETYDFGMSLTGNWNATVGGVAAAGSIMQYLETSPDNSTWTQYSALSAKTSARFARVRVTAAAASAFKVTVPTVSIRIDAVPRQENGMNVMSLSSGPKTIYLANAYAAVEAVNVTLLGTTMLSHTEDNISYAAPSGSDKASNITVTDMTIALNAVTGAWALARAKHAIPSGKWYWETKINTIGASAWHMYGVADSSLATVGYPGNTATTWGYYCLNGNFFNNGAAVAFGAALTVGDVLGIAFDTVAGTLQFFKNGVSQGTKTGITGTLFPAWALYDNAVTTESAIIRTRSQEFSYTPPAGFSPLPWAFNVYCFNQAGTQVANAFNWNFQGV